MPYPGADQLVFTFNRLALLPTWGPVQRLFQKVVVWVSADDSDCDYDEEQGARIKMKERERRDDDEEKV